MMPGRAAGNTTREHRSRARGSQRERALAQSRWHEQQQFLGGTHDERNHHDAECDAAGRGRKVPKGQHGDCVDEDADDNRRYAVEGVGGKPNAGSET